MSTTDPRRNRPAEEGTNNDPNVRDYTGQQPGVSTMSSSDTDEGNNDLSETAADNFREEDFGSNADPSFNEIGEDD